MEDYRQPTWAILVILLWLVSGVVLVASLGAGWTPLGTRIVVAGFVLVTLAMARAVTVLMDREERRFPLWAMGVVLATAGIVALFALLG